MKPKISIALATYNGSAYLQEQLDSYISQSRLPDELVISDDGSTDDTVAICEDFARKAPFEVNIYTNSRNLGPTKNFENAISRCTGDFIFLSDQDDVWLPDKVKILADTFLAGTGIDIVFCDARMCNENLIPLGYSIWEALGFTAVKHKKVQSGNAFEVFLQYPMIAGMTMAFQANYNDILLPFPALQSCHDTWILLLISALSGVGMVDRKLTMHRVHGNNVSGITLKNLYQQYKKAKDQIKNDRLKYEMALHQAIFNRIFAIKDEMNAPASTIDAIVQKINHLQKRLNIPKSYFKKIPEIYRELSKGNYALYSYGWKSALQDLFLR